jgi:uncharacterized Zn finger protein
MMSWYGDYGDWPPRVPVATKIARGRAAAKKLAKKEGREPCPITIDGRKIAKTFWGLTWCENLDRYRDISNRLPRGATYVRNGSVSDLVIEPGKVRAVVGGTEAYTVKITIQTLKQDVWKAIGRDCAQEIDSLFDLLQGRFNEGVMQRLTRAEGGLFPHKNQISMSCTCPDSAGVCKHIAATFYGVAARLDRQPELLFKLRNVDHLELIGQATSAANLDQALDSSAAATLSDSDLGSIFGIDLEPAASVLPRPVRSPAKRPVRTKNAAVASTAAAAASCRKRGKRDVPVAQASAKRSPRSAAKSTTKSAVSQTIGKSSSKSLKTSASKRRKPQQPAPAVVSAARKRPRKKKAASLQVVQAQGRHEQVR